jgi:hypothetical protein
MVTALAAFAVIALVLIVGKRYNVSLAPAGMIHGASLDYSKQIASQLLQLGILSDDYLMILLGERASRMARYERLKTTMVKKSAKKPIAYAQEIAEMTEILALEKRMLHVYQSDVYTYENSLADSSALHTMFAYASAQRLLHDIADLEDYMQAIKTKRKSWATQEEKIDSLIKVNERAIDYYVYTLSRLCILGCSTEQLHARYIKNQIVDRLEAIEQLERELLS